MIPEGEGLFSCSLRVLITGNLSAGKPFWASKLSRWVSSQGNSGQGATLILADKVRAFW